LLHGRGYFKFSWGFLAWLRFWPGLVWFLGFGYGFGLQRNLITFLRHLYTMMGAVPGWTIIYCCSCVSLAI